MKIKSSKIKTRHILVSITPYSPYGEGDEFMEFGFLYFKYTHEIERNIKLFHKKWRKAKRRIPRFPVEIDDAILLNRSAIENSDNMDNPDYRHIRYDSLNYLKDEPVFNDCDSFYKIPATMLLYFDYFQIYVERIPDGYGACPSIIYRTGANYTKLINYKNGKIV